MRKLYFLLFLAGCLLYSTPSHLHAQEITEDFQETVKARVLEIKSEKTEPVPGTDTTHQVQYIRVTILSGEKAGSIIEIENDYAQLKKMISFI